MCFYGVCVRTPGIQYIIYVFEYCDVLVLFHALCLTDMSTHMSYVHNYDHGLQKCRSRSTKMAITEFLWKRVVIGYRVRMYLRIWNLTSVSKYYNYCRLKRIGDGRSVRAIIFTKY